MNSRRTLVGLALLVLLVTLCATAQSSSPWAWGPILGAVGDDLVVISWETSRSVSVDLHYGLAQVHDASGAWDETLTFDRQEGRAEIWLRDLTPGTDYRFQLIAYEGDAVYPTKLGSFHTSSQTARSFSFAVYGHTASFPDRHKLVADTIAHDEADAAFVVHVGKLVDSLTPERIGNYLWAIDDLARSTAYLTVVGSDDPNQTAYYQTFALPQGGGVAGEQWWSFDYGIVHVLGLDSTLTDPSRARAQEQLAWLRRDLATTDATFVVVLTTSGLYGSSYPDGRNEALVALWEPIFRANGVDLVLSAQIGGYEHVYAGGIHHITTGGGGGPLAEPPDGSVPRLVFSRYGLLHYIRITLADDALQAEAVPVASIIADEIYLTPSSRAIDTVVIRPDAK